MPEFFDLPVDDRSEALELAAARSGRPAYLLEKDIWVVWCLQRVFSGPDAGHLVFKGGTSLSKVYGVISRFSEDIDLTYDVRAIAADLLGDNGSPIPKSPSQAKKWTNKIRERLPAWVADQFAPGLAQALKAQHLPATARIQGEAVYVGYQTILSTGSSYISPWVKLELGARATGEPCQSHTVSCDAAAYVDDVQFPSAEPRVMAAERTFWEKATAIHVYCLKGKFGNADRFARHWYDMVRLHHAG